MTLSTTFVDMNFLINQVVNLKKHNGNKNFISSIQYIKNIVIVINKIL